MLPSTDSSLSRWARYGNLHRSESQSQIIRIRFISCLVKLWFAWYWARYLWLYLLLEGRKILPYWILSKGILDLNISKNRWKSIYFRPHTLHTFHPKFGTIGSWCAQICFNFQCYRRQSLCVSIPTCRGRFENHLSAEPTSEYRICVRWIITVSQCTFKSPSLWHARILICGLVYRVSFEKFLYLYRGST